MAPMTGAFTSSQRLCNLPSCHEAAGHFFLSRDVTQEGAACSDSSFVRARSVQCNPDKMGFLLFLMTASTISKACIFLFAHALCFP